MSTHAGRGPHLIHAVSYERRGTTSLETLLGTTRIGHVHLLYFPVEQYLSRTQQGVWRAQSEEARALLESNSIQYTPYHVNDRGPQRWAFLEGCDELDDPVIVNITTMPKIFIMALAARMFHKRNVSFFYQRQGGHWIESESDHDISITDVVAVEGLEGRPSSRSAQYLVALLGYEGLRSWRSWKSVLPSAAPIGLVGLPNWTGSPFAGDVARLTDEDQIYLKTVRRYNRRLLDSPGCREAWVNSLDPESCRRQLEELWTTLKSEGARAESVSLLPNGTKAQCLSVAAFALVHPEVQVLYAVPSKRAPINGDPGQAWIFSLENRGGSVSFASSRQSTPQVSRPT